MSEEQIEPTRRWYKRWQLYLFILVIIVIVAVVIIMSGGGVFVQPGGSLAYDTSKAELQNAVNDYRDRNNGALPTINGTVTINGSSYAIINICPLLNQDEESLQKVIQSLWCGNGSNDDNWDNGCAECTTWSSYVWAVDDEGNVYSTCVGEYCEANGEDGYQGVWP